VSDITIVGIIIACVVVLFVTNRVPVIVVAMATPLALWATGVLSLQTVLSGFGDPAVIFIAALFVVSAALEQSGVTAWAGQWLIAQAGEDSRTRLLLLTMVLVALLTALISVNGAVAALLSVFTASAVQAATVCQKGNWILRKLAMSANSLIIPTAAQSDTMMADNKADKCRRQNVPANRSEAAMKRTTFESFLMNGIPRKMADTGYLRLYNRRI
jgi:Na+/H+ antiporter NhaD/arsenite permease-like protein